MLASSVVICSRLTGSVMPSYPWVFYENDQPNKRGLAVVTYLQWLGSWIPEDEAAPTIYNTSVLTGGDR